MLGFYTPAFRDLFFSDDPPKHMFRAVVTVLAGYWRPSLATRAWLALFFLTVRLQRRFGFVPSHVAESSRSPDRPRIAAWPRLLARALTGHGGSMRVVVLTLLAVFTGRLAAPSEPLAQYHRLTDAIVVGGTLAAAGSGAEVLAGGPEMGGLIEIPMGDTLRLRGEAAIGAWHFDGYPTPGSPAAACSGTG